MIEPKGPKPGPARHPDAAEPHFEQGDTEQPMYATEPEAPAPQRGSAGSSGASFGGGWEVPGQDPAGQASRGHRQADRAQAGQASQASQDDPFDPSRSAADPRQQSGQAGQASGSRKEAGAGPADANAELKAALAAAEARAQESHEQYLRALADMENVRRRAQEDVSKAHKFAIEAFAESMLPVRDSLEMALTVEVPSVENLREGVEATLRQLTHAFERNRVLVLDPLHQKFDPNLHQAISMVPSRDVAPNHVVSVLQKGYMINDRILRPALVTVSQTA
jgi:molecular chaperone GrpE